ncbi:MAG: adenylate/guanylate cyclase domain-containing protein [Flavobacteriales bacterium]
MRSLNALLQRTIVVCLAFTACLSAMGQTDEMDSLRTRLRTEGPTTARVDMLIRVGMWTYDATGDTACLAYLKEAATFSTTLGYRVGMAYIPCVKAIRLNQQEDYRGSINAWKESIELLDREHVEQLYFSPLSFIRVAYNSSGWQEERLVFYETAVERYRRTGPEVNLAASYHGLAGYYLQSDQYALAIENYLKSGEYYKGRDPEAAANETLMAGWSYRMWGNADRAEPYIRKALKENEEQHYFAGMSECYMELGRLELLRGDTLKALQCFKDTRVSWPRVPILQQGVCRVLLAMSYIWTGQLDSARMELDTVNVIAAKNYLPISSISGDCEVSFGNYLYQRAVGNRDAATRYLEKALGEAKTLYSLGLVLKYELELSNQYKAAGRDREALDLALDHARLSDSLKTITSKGALAAYENTVQERESALEIERQKANVQQQQERLRQQRIISFSIAGGLLLLVALAFSVYRGKKRSDELLLNILPEEVANELKANGHAVAKQFDSATILFTDFKGFTEASEKLTPQALVEELNTCFEAFDHIITARGIEKIKTIGDAYMCVGGLPDPKTSSPADVVHAALKMQAFMIARKKERDAQGLPVFEMRVGIHTGPVVAGIVGVKKFQYDIWGDTVNTASRMESSGEVGQVNISEATYDLVKKVTEVWEEREVPAFVFTLRGKVQAKGKGELEMYFVDLA